MASNLTLASSGRWFAEWRLAMEEMIDEFSRRLKDFPAIDFSDMSPAFVQLYTKKSEDLQSGLFEISCELGSFLEELNPAIVPWLPSDESLFNNMKFHRGSCPWSFVLSYSLPEVDLFGGISVETLQRHLGIPKPGDFLCCQLDDKWFRGVFIQMISPNRFEVVDIDSNDTYVVHKSGVYHCPPKLCDIHALSIHCTALEDNSQLLRSLGDLWCKELEQVFTQTVRNRSLKIKILETFPTIPPKYQIELLVRRSDGVEYNISEWLTKYLIPDAKSSYPLITTKEGLLFYLKDESMYPFSIGNVWKVETSPQEREKRPMPAKFSAYSEDFSQHYNCSQNMVVAKQESVQEESGDTSHDSKPSFEAPSLGDQPFSCGRGYADLLLKCGVNKIHLPCINEQANVLIAQVASDLSFYVLLEAKYSNWNTESYSTMMARLNNPACSQREPLVGSPNTGDLVIHKGVKDFWARGVILETYELQNLPSVVIFNPDLGELTEVCGWENLRTPLEVDKILPFQAVLSFLHGIRLVDGCGKKAQEYFTNLVSAKELHIIVKAIDFANTQMVVELFTADEVSVNRALVATGFCVEA